MEDYIPGNCHIHNYVYLITRYFTNLRKTGGIIILEGQTEWIQSAVLYADL